MLKEDKSKKREERHKITQEDFTPLCVVEDMLNRLPQELFTNLSKTIIDFSCGIGNFLVEVLKRKLNNTQNEYDVPIVLRSIYGVELMADNVEECRNRLYNCVLEKYPQIENNVNLNYEVRAIIRNRIQWHDSLQFDYNHWPSINAKPRAKHLNITFREKRDSEFTKYPMWFKEPKKEVIELSLFADTDFE